MTHIKDTNAPNLIADKNGELVGIVTKWNPCGFGECIVQYFDGSADSDFFGELIFPNGVNEARTYLDSLEQW